MTLAAALKQGPLFAFNIDSWLTLKAVAAVVRRRQQATIVAVSEGEAHFWGLPQFQALVASFRQQGLPLFLNLDHGRRLKTIRQALTLHFDMIHIDGSNLSLVANIRRCQPLVAAAHRRGILVEVEPDEHFSQPEHLQQLLQATQADLGAVFAGNRHGYQPYQSERLDLARLQQLKKVAGKAYLTLHGGSGVSFPDLRQALGSGLIRKINVNSRLRYLLRRRWQEVLQENPSWKYYQLAQPVVAVLEREIERYFRVLNDG